MCPTAVVVFKQVINGVSNFADMKDCVVSYGSYIAQKWEHALEIKFISIISNSESLISKV